MSQDISALRKEYSQARLELSDANSDPIRQFEKWIEEALNAELPEVNAMHLSTVDANNRPHGRIVLLKAYDERGFVFFTNYESQKGRELEANPVAALTFFWVELERQVRIEGEVTRILESESDAYFYSRPIESQMGAMASPQSQPIESREWLEARFENIKNGSEKVDRPTYWGGYLVTPYRLEFWQGRPSRLHDRIRYSLHGKEWQLERLAP